MLPKGLKKAQNRDGGGTNTTCGLPGGTERSLPEGSYGRTPKLRMLGTFGHLRDLFRSPSSNHHREEYTKEDTQDNLANDEGAKNVKVNIESIQTTVQDVGDVWGADRATTLVENGSSAVHHFDSMAASLRHLKTFNSIVNAINHPYTEIVFGTLSWASQVLLSQKDRDQSLNDLLFKFDHVYSFILENNTLVNINLIREPLGKIGESVRKGALFVQNFTEMKNFWGRLGKNVSAETASVIAAYSRDLDSLTQQCRDLITRNTHGDVRKVLDGISQVQGDINSTRDVIQGDTCHALGGIGRALDEVARADLKVQINQLAYADGAGLNNSKSCLDGTRTTLLLEIMDWIYDVEGDPRRILWLHGQAGKGKSVIAHSIAKQCKELGRLGSCFCFARDRMADLRHEKIFSTLARDLCDYDLDFGHALASILSKDNALAHCSDTTQQWQKFILQPFSRISVCTRAPILIVVDALDESGDEASRLHILEILTSLEVASLPPNIRILITSRPLTDITERLQSVLHIKSKSMDGISIDTAKSDIQVYIKHQLRTLVDGLSEKETGFLAEMSDGLFEWARLACEFIRSFKEATTPSKQYQSLILAMSGGREDLLGNMYKAILDNALGKSYGTYVRFRSVMCQILCTKEPLSIDSLNAMRRKFPEKEDIYDVDLILRSLGALFSGIVDRSTPVRPLHASFYDFLTEGPWSEEFAVGIKEMHMSLALASLNVMQEELCFNICNLENSYMRNSAVKDLNVKLKEYISSHLSYTCRFWVDHAKEVKYNKNLEKLVKAFFKEKLLFWMEALSLLKGLNNAPTALLCIAQWMEKILPEISASARDSIKFLAVFGSAIMDSTPHLYISALALSPQNSVLFKEFSPRYPWLAQVEGDENADWPNQQITLQGHTLPVTSVAFSPDGKKIASGSEDSTICLWDAETGLQLANPFKGHTDYVTSVAFSPDGKRIVSGALDNTICLWDVETGLQMGTPIKGHTSYVTSVAFSPDGKRIVSGSEDKTICLWDAENRSQLVGPLEGHTSYVTSVVFSPDGKQVASGSWDRTICLWDTLSGNQLGSPLRRHTSCITSVSFSPDGKRIASGSWDNSICLWDAQTRFPLGSPFKGHTSYVSSIAFSPDGKRIASGSWDKNIYLWDAETGLQLASPLRGHTSYITSIAFSPDGKRIASGSEDSTIHLQDVETVLQLASPFEGHTDYVSSVAFSPDGKRIVSGSWDKTICLWDTETGLQLAAPLKGHASYVSTVAFSPDGKRIASGSWDNTICIWDAETGLQLASPLTRHTNYVTSVAFSPDGKRIASGALDKIICLWDVETGLQLGTPLKGHTSYVTSVAFSSDGKLIVSGSDDTICLWDAESGLQLASHFGGHTPSVTSVAFSPDGRKIVSGALDKTVCLWDSETGLQLASPLKGHNSWVTSVAFSPDGKKIASSSSDNTICLWDADTGLQLISPFRGHNDYVTSVTFSPDGKMIASGSKDKTIRLWNVETGLQLAIPLKGHTYVTSMSFSQDGKGNTSSSEDKTASVCILGGADSCSLALDIVKVSHFAPYYSPIYTNGWIVGPQGQAVLWIPPSLLALPFRSYGLNHVITMHRGLKLNLNKMVHGLRWMDCQGA